MNPEIRRVMKEIDEIIGAGFSALSRARQQQHVHLTDKELFFAGAGFVFDAIVHAMSPGDEPTQDDMTLLSKLHAELTKFHVHFNAKFK